MSSSFKWESNNTQSVFRLLRRIKQQNSMHIPKWLIIISAIDRDIFASRKVAHPFSLCVLQTLDEMARGCQWGRGDEPGSSSQQLQCSGCLHQGSGLLQCYSPSLRNHEGTWLSCVIHRAACYLPEFIFFSDSLPFFQLKLSHFLMPLMLLGKLFSRTEQFSHRESASLRDRRVCPV